MNPLALAAFLSLAIAPASVADNFDQSITAPVLDPKWRQKGVQENKVVNPDGTTSADSTKQASPKDLLRIWEKGCKAIKELEEAPYSEKRGIGVPNNANRAPQIVVNLGSFWYYNWETSPLTGITGTQAEFTPMIRDNDASRVNDNLQGIHALQPPPRYVLGYDEPKLHNIGAADPDNVWPQYTRDPHFPQGTVGPASSDVNWFNDFVDHGNAQNFKLVAIRLYEEMEPEDSTNAKRMEESENINSAVTNFKRRLEEVEKKAKGKQIWVTGFGLTAQRGRPAEFTQEQAACFMAKVIPFLEKQKNVMRYAWFSPNPSAQDSEKKTLPDALWDRDGSLTSLGELYHQEK